MFLVGLVGVSLMVAAGACVEEIVGLVLEESGYQERLKESDDEADLIAYCARAY